MALSLLDTCQFNGPALPDPFVRYELEKELSKLGVLQKTIGEEGKQHHARWEVYRRRLRELAARGGPLRVRHCVVDPLVELLGFDTIQAAGEVKTREGDEPGGFLLSAQGKPQRLRVWTTEFDEDLDAPSKRGAAYRYSHLRIAQRVLLASGERIGILTNGTELRILLSDPARPDSEIIIPIESEWKRRRDLPDSFRLVLALCQPKGIEAIADLVDKARQQQVRVTKDLRLQARAAVENFIQEVLDHPANAAELQNHPDKTQLAKDLWHEGLVLVYRLLFVLKLESTDDPARAFSFTSSSLWRNTFSPGTALAPRVRDVLDDGKETGHYLEQALRNLFRMFAEGLECSELHVKPLGGALFGAEAAPLLDQKFQWGERAVAHLLDRLLWTQRQRGESTRQRVHYGALDVEDLGRVYEALLELDAGISTERLCRLRRQKLEVVVPVAQGEKYHSATTTPASPDDENDEDNESADEEEESAASKKKTKIEWIEEIPPGRFFLRVGLGRKATGSYYTPHSFVRFLVQETLGPLCDERSPKHDPDPGAILKLKVLDPAMGSGHFLVEACRFLAEKLYEACRLCDEYAEPAERRAELAARDEIKAEAMAEAAKWRGRVIALPDPNDEILQYLPSRAPEGIESGISQRRALALCRRLVAVHCLYGVDKNRLAVELAKLSLWLESHAEGLPLTFLDHRLVEGDSLTGPFIEHLLTYPNSREPLAGLFAQGLEQRLNASLGDALLLVADLESTVGATVAETERKAATKLKLDRALAPFRTIAAAWAGRVLHGKEASFDYTQLVHQVLAGSSAEDTVAELSAFPYELAFPEVFYPSGNLRLRRGFDVIVGNPPWEGIRRADDQFFGGRDFEALAGATKKEKKAVQQRLLNDPDVKADYDTYVESYERQDRASDVLFSVHQARVNGQLAGRGTYDSYMLFAERAYQLLNPDGLVGWVLPSGFHANEGATGVRRLYFEQMATLCCYSFENKRRLFEIHSSFKYAALVAKRAGPTTAFRCSFYLHDDEWLFGDRSDRELTYTLDFVRSSGEEYLNLLELRSADDLDVARVCFTNGRPFGKVCEELGIKLSQELNMTYDADEFFTPIEEILPGGEDPRDPEVAATLLERGFLPLHEGKTFHQYTDRWEDRPRYVVAVKKLSHRKEILEAARYYRLAFRDIASSTNERTLILTMLPPCVFSNKAPSERYPGDRPNASALALLAASNSFVCDWTLRLKVASTVNFFLLNASRVPPFSGIRTFLAHAALRLVSNHVGYRDLWAEQLGSRGSDVRPASLLNPLTKISDRRELLAAVDAVVAHSFRLTRSQYSHVLSGFSNRTDSAYADLCIEKYDQLTVLGHDSYFRRYDPLHDSSPPLNNAPPIVNFGGIGEAPNDFDLSSFSVAVPRKGRRP